MTNYYSLLGIPNFSDYSAVRKAYIKQIRLYHPDVNPTEYAAEKSKLLNVAKEALETADKKMAYDRRLKSYLNPQFSYVPPQPKTTSKQKTYSSAQQRRRQAHINRIRSKMEQYERGLKNFPLNVRYWTIGSLAGVFYLIFAYSIFSSSDLQMYHFVWSAVYWFFILQAINEYYKYHDWRRYKREGNREYRKKSRIYHHYLVYGGIGLVLILKFLYATLA